MGKSGGGQPNGGGWWEEVVDTLLDTIGRVVVELRKDGDNEKSAC